MVSEGALENVQPVRLIGMDRDAELTANETRLGSLPYLVGEEIGGSGRATTCGGRYA